jgi:hypothetical protein
MADPLERDTGESVLKTGVSRNEATSPVSTELRTAAYQDKIVQGLV